MKLLLLLLSLGFLSSLTAQSTNDNDSSYSVNFGVYDKFVKDVHGVYALESLPKHFLDDLYELDSIVFSVLFANKYFEESIRKLEYIKSSELFVARTRAMNYIVDFKSLEKYRRTSELFFDAYADASNPVDKNLVSRLNNQLNNIVLENDIEDFGIRVVSFKSDLERLMNDYRKRSTQSNSQAQVDKYSVQYEYVKQFYCQKFLPMTWIYKDLSGVDIVNSIKSSPKKMPKELFAEFLNKKFPVIQDYFVSKQAQKIAIKDNVFKISEDSYAKHFIIHVAMFNRDFYFDITDYKNSVEYFDYDIIPYNKKMHSITLMEVY